MKVDEASRVLAQMYQDALEGEKVLSIHLFGIKYADQIQDLRPEDIVTGAEMFKSYATEVRKGIRLAKYVEVKG